MPEEKVYLATVKLSICTESTSCEANYTIFDNVLLPKMQCDWNEGFTNSSNSFYFIFYVMSWATNFDKSICIAYIFVIFRFFGICLDDKQRLYPSFKEISVCWAYERNESFTISYEWLMLGCRPDLFQIKRWLE